MTSRLTDVAVIGAGPYGLSVSAYLTARGIEHRIFGPPMQTWRGMPKGMCLKSLDFASNVYTPRKGFSLIDYAEQNSLSHAEPITAELFSSYGMWAQQQLVPQLEQTSVTRLARANGGFAIELGTGEQLEAKRVVMATGLAYFAQLPQVLRGLPKELVTHTSDHRDYEAYRGKDVAIVGYGQSAIEAAVMLHEAGARPKMLTRTPGATFASPPAKQRILRHKILHPMSVLGASRMGFFLQRVPHGFYFLPDARRVELTRKLYGPWGAWWIAERFQGKVPGVGNIDILSAKPGDSRITVRVRERLNGVESDLVFDHVVAGTGYEPDLEVIPFLDRGLAREIRRIERSPKLTANFESSVPGLFFVGASAAFSFGPLLRFVAGAAFAAPTVAGALAGDKLASAFRLMTPVAPPA
jgi:thioredoxin reductase